MSIVLTRKQTEALDILENKTTTDIVFGGGAGGAKSFLGCFWIFQNACQYEGTRWVIGRKELKRLKETTLNTLFDVFKKSEFTSEYYNYNDQKSVFTFWNGSEILLKDLKHNPSDPDFDSLGSLEITGAFIDECAEVAHKAWQILRSRIRYKLDVYDLVPKILGTCNPTKNWVYSHFYQKSKNNELEKDKAFIQSLIGDNPYISKTYKENLLRLDEASKQRLLYGNWDYDDDPQKLCDTQKIYELWENDFIKTTGIPGDRYLTADIALNGSDKFIIGIWDGFVLIDIDTMDKSNGQEVYDKIKSLQLKYGVPNSNICYDSDGIGNFFKGMIKGSRAYTANRSKKALKGESKKYQCLNDQCIFYLCDYINQNRIGIRSHLKDKHQEPINQELGIVRNHTYDTDTRLAVTPKKIIMEQIGRSPDYLDMLKMRMLFELLPKTRGVR